MPDIRDRLQRKRNGLQARDQQLAAEATRINDERRSLATAIADIEVALRVISENETADDDDPGADAYALIPEEVTAEAEEIIARHAAIEAELRFSRTLADACALGLHWLGGEAAGRQLYRLLLNSGRLTQNGGNPHKAYNQMAGALRKNPSRFAKVGYARWRLLPEG